MKQIIYKLQKRLFITNLVFFTNNNVGYIQFKSNQGSNLENVAIGLKVKLSNKTYISLVFNQLFDNAHLENFFIDFLFIYFISNHPFQ
jgi:hypothetical protein